MRRPNKESEIGAVEKHDRQYRNFISMRGTLFDTTACDSETRLRNSKTMDSSSISIIFFQGEKQYFFTPRIFKKKKYKKEVIYCTYFYTSIFKEKTKYKKVKKKQYFFYTSNFKKKQNTKTR